MPLSWNEIRDRATAFAHDWADESYERGEAQTFWTEFFRVFGLERRRVASFEAHVKKLGDSHGYIDCFWPGTLIAEHKSLGKDLDSAYLQAVGYFAELKERDLPRYVVVSDFATIRLHDLEEDHQVEFPLADLYDPLTMPPALLKAHRALDKAVDGAYSRKKFSGDADRVAFLFELYQELVESQASV